MRLEVRAGTLFRGSQREERDGPAIHRRRSAETVHRVVTVVRMVLDALCLAAALGIAAAVRSRAETAGAPGPYVRWLAIWLLLWWFGLLFVGLYDGRRIRNPAEELGLVARGVTLGAALAAVVAFSARSPLSRGWLALAWVMALVLVIGERRVVRKVIHRLHRRGYLRRAVLIVGADAGARSLSEAVAEAPWEGLEVVGFVPVEGSSIDPAVRASVVGDVGRLRRLVAMMGVSEVLVAPSVAGGRHLADVVAALDGVPVQLSVAPGLEGYLASRLSVHPLGDRPIVALERMELRPAARLIKRTFDLIVAGLLLVLGAPVFAMCAIAVHLDSPGGAFFRQRRIGVGGRAFTMWKFRTMVSSAERSIEELRASNEGDGLLFKMKCDPRVTRVGRVLRRTSLDELPQLLNVVIGQMSLVGPRPPLPEEVARYDERIRRRLLVKPGMTGLWQVSGRHASSFDDYVRFDLLYVQNWSLALDFYILARTVPAVLSGRGAY